MNETFMGGSVVKYYRIRMIHNDLKNSNVDKPLPEGYYFRNFQAGDESIWADIETAAGEFPSKDKALERFMDEFGDWSPSWLPDVFSCVTRTTDP